MGQPGLVVVQYYCRATAHSLLHYTFDVGAIPSTCTAKSARPSSRNTNCANCHVRATHRLLMNTSPRTIVCKERDAKCARQIFMTNVSHSKAQLYYLCLFSNEFELPEVNCGEENLCCNEGECKGFSERNGKFQTCGVSSVCEEKAIVSQCV